MCFLNFFITGQNMNLLKQLILGSVVCYSSVSMAFELTSTDIKANSTLTQAQVFNGFGCTGQNISPALQWKNAPKGTKSFAVTVYDPDAPTGSGWWHWVVYNLPATTNSLATGVGIENSTTLPEGTQQGRTDFGSYSFGGACPPKGHGKHRYIFSVYALNTEKIEVPHDASPALIGYMINANKLAKATFTAKYSR